MVSLSEEHYRSFHRALLTTDDTRSAKDFEKAFDLLLRDVLQGRLEPEHWSGADARKTHA
jgi:hypothetical protein